MKTFNTILLGLMALCLTAKAQTTEVNPLTLEGEELKEYLSEPMNKAEYIAQLNASISQSEECARWGVEIYDADVTIDTTQTSPRQGSRRANPLDAAGFCSLFYTYKIYYSSVNGQNRPTRLSAMVYSPESITDDDKDICFGLLSCHPTVTSLFECPTGPDAPEAAIRAMAWEDCLVVCPDYCGYGLSANETHPYLIQDVTARNCIDAYQSAMSVFSKQLKNGFHTYIVGYSQGGSVAMACHKMYETHLSQVTKDKINLVRTYCGDGPYSPYMTINQYLTWQNSSNPADRILAYPSVMGLILLGAKDAYDKEYMRTVNAEDYFKPEYLSLTNALEVIKSKTARTTEINQDIWSKGIQTMDQIMSEKLLIYDEETQQWKFNTSANECKCLLRALQKNDVAAGWSPTIPITILHYSGDMVVPYANYQYIKRLVDEKQWDGTKVTFVEAESAHKNGKIALLVKSTVDAALATGWDHVTVGTLFYCWFMFGEDNENYRKANKKMYNK